MLDPVTLQRELAVTQSDALNALVAEPLTIPTMSTELETWTMPQLTSDGMLDVMAERV